YDEGVTTSAAPTSGLSRTQSCGSEAVVQITASPISSLRVCISVAALAHMKSECGRNELYLERKPCVNVLMVLSGMIFVADKLAREARKMSLSHAMSSVGNGISKA